MGYGRVICINEVTVTNHFVHFDVGNHVIVAHHVQEFERGVLLFRIVHKSALPAILEIWVFVA